jgi:single-strand DNA-binding protein
MSYINIQIIGYVGADPETRVSPSGEELTSFSLAINENRKTDDGYIETSRWFKVYCQGKTAKNVMDYVKKGSQVYVTGNPKLPKAYVSKKDGTTKIAEDIWADKIVFLSGESKLKQGLVIDD